MQVPIWMWVLIATLIILVVIAYFSWRSIEKEKKEEEVSQTAEEVFERIKRQLNNQFVSA